jgi:hypothetical protein
LAVALQLLERRRVLPSRFNRHLRPHFHSLGHSEDLEPALPRACHCWVRA